MFGFKTKCAELNKIDVNKFYLLYQKLSKISDITGVISKNFKETLKYIHKKYDKSYTILANENTKSVIVVKEDFLEKYIILDTTLDLVNSKYKFRRYI